MISTPYHTHTESSNHESYKEHCLYFPTILASKMDSFVPEGIMERWLPYLRVREDREESAVLGL